MEISAIHHDPERRQYYLFADGHRAFVDYVERDGEIALVHSEVPAALRGRGEGRILVERTFEQLERDGLSAVAVCSYIRAIAKRSARWREVIRH